MDWYLLEISLVQGSILSHSTQGPVPRQFPTKSAAWTQHHSAFLPQAYSHTDDTASGAFWLSRSSSSTLWQNLIGNSELKKPSGWRLLALDQRVHKFQGRLSSQSLLLENANVQWQTGWRSDQTAVLFDKARCFIDAQQSTLNSFLCGLCCSISIVWLSWLTIFTVLAANIIRNQAWLYVWEHF